jgi:hypothetical protein
MLNDESVKGMLDVVLGDGLDDELGDYSVEEMLDGVLDELGD